MHKPSDSSADQASEQQARPPADATEQRILDAAAELVIRYGYDKTTVSNIADAAGIAKGTVYLRFASKDDLLEALLRREMWRYGASWLAAVEADPQGGTLGGIFKNVLAGLQASPLMVVIFTRDATILGNYLRKPGNLFQTVEANAMRAEFIQALQAAGAVRQDVDPALVAQIMEMMTYGLISHPTQDKLVPALLETIATMMDRAFTPPDGGDSAAGKAVIRRITAAAREHFGPSDQAAP